MLVNPAQAASFLSVLGPTMKASGLSTKVACCDTLGFNLLPSYVSAVAGDAGRQRRHPGCSPATGTPTRPPRRSAPAADRCGSRSGPSTAAPATPPGTTAATDSGITWAQRIHDGLTGANLNAFLYWWGISNTSHDSSLIGLSGSTLTPSKRYYALANYSRFIRPGAVRIAATSGDSNLQVSAFRNSDGSVVVVALNTRQQRHVDELHA